MEREKSIPAKVAEIFTRDPREPYNVLYVYGPDSETEKYADRIQRGYGENHPGAEIIRETGAEFCRLYVERVKSGRRYDAWAYRNCELLILEHIQEAAGRESAEEILYGILDNMLRRGRAILVTGDRPVPDLTALEDRICAQLSGGISLELTNEE